MADDDAAELLEVTMAAIKRKFDAEDFEQALPYCSKALELKPDSAVVRRCRVFALLSLSRWADALQVCEKLADEVEAFAFERAYCLYRLNRFQEALDALKAADDAADDAPRRTRLEAQVRYRMGDYAECAGMYEKLYGEDTEEVGLLVNAVASRVSGDKPREALRCTSEQEALLESSYELCFNSACALIDMGRLGEAATRLEEAKDLCVKELLQAEELAEEEANLLEDHEELAALHVQRGVVLQRQGENDAANELYQRVLRQRTGPEVDITVLAVACNNVVALRSEGKKSLFDSLKRINVASKESLEHKLTRKQNIEIAINKCLLFLQAHKLDDAKRELQRLRESYPGHPRVAVIQAAIAHTDKKAKACEEVLQAYLTENPGCEEVLLPLAQLHAQQQKYDRAVEALSQLPPHRRAQPSTVEAIVALHQRQKNPEKAVACLREAVAFWTSQEGNDADEETFAEVLRIAARLAMRLGDHAFAAEAFQLYVERIDGSDSEALCGLVRALASTDAEKAEQYAQRLRVPSYAHLDAEELEAADIPKIGQNLKKPAAAAVVAKEATTATAEASEEAAAPEAKAVKPKRKRKRKPRYPKGYDPENPGPPPDPERWLPKRERAEFKKRMRKRDKNLARGPQGSMPVDDNAFRKQGPSTAQVEVAKDTRVGKPRNQGRKKAAGTK
mmetsp:Transcript_7609/g.15869  ORF Transcript_7609/g.15869 Transcript_7609/m.15869 type:complete len:677 (+) Transcript_7609:204-2234(+)